MHDRAKHCGWAAPLPHQRLRAMSSAHPLWSIYLPNAGEAADNSGLCINLDQGAQGSCTANAWAQVLAMEMGREGLNVFTPARRANYW
jgi:hypothetical protein